MVTILENYENGQDMLIFALIHAQNPWGLLLSFWGLCMHNSVRFDW